MSVLFDKFPESFRGKIAIRESGCWDWMGSRYGNGYGRYLPPKDRRMATGKDQRVLAHRFAYTLAFGGPKNEVINHLCENKACVNPEHLEDVTQSRNVRYSLSDTCPQGHPLTRGHPNTYIHPRTDKRKCRACMRERKRAEYRADPEKFRARKRADYVANPEAARAEARSRYEQNREVMLERKRADYWRDPEKYRARAREQYNRKAQERAS